MDERTYRCYPNVELGADVEVQDFCILGQPGSTSRARSTVIGGGATIRSHTVIYAGVHIGDRFQCGHGVLIREDTTIGSDCSVGSGSCLEHGVIVGNRVRLHSQCFVPEFSVLADGCWLGPRVVITNSRYPASSRSKRTLEPVHVGVRARIGANVTILPGVRIGESALVGAGSVVTHNVGPGAVVVGNPAHVTGRAHELQDAEGVIYGEVR